MGAVYQAEHTHMRKRLAVKVLHPEMSRMPEVVARFEREAMAAAHIDHPNVAAATDFGKLDDGSFFLVLEYVEGKSLREVITEGRLELGRAMHVTRQIASALGRAHALGIVHRDLKPENVMLVARDGDPDFVKVLDFGIAKVPIGGLIGEPKTTGPTGQVLTQLGMVYGTPEYMAPEQALGQPVDARADLYALGVMTFEMIVGARPLRAREQGHAARDARDGAHPEDERPRRRRQRPGRGRRDRHAAPGEGGLGALRGFEGARRRARRRRRPAGRDRAHRRAVAAAFPRPGSAPDIASAHAVARQRRSGAEPDEPGQPRRDGPARPTRIPRRCDAQSGAPVGAPVDDAEEGDGGGGRLWPPFSWRSWSSPLRRTGARRLPVRRSAAARAPPRRAPRIRRPTTSSRPRRARSTRETSRRPSTSSRPSKRQAPIGPTCTSSSSAPTRASATAAKRCARGASGSHRTPTPAPIPSCRRTCATRRCSRTRRTTPSRSSSRRWARCGIDILYDIAFGASGRQYPQAATRARHSLEVDDVRGRASPALAVLLDFRDAKTCDAEARAPRSTRAITATRGCCSLLQPYVATRGCGFLEPLRLLPLHAQGLPRSATQ